MTSLTRFMFSVRRVTAAKGVWGLITSAWQRLLRTRVIPRVVVAEYPFDARYGVRTAGLANETGTDQREYYGINASVFRGAIQRWMNTLHSPGEVAQYTFVDLGSGLGRALLLASELPFREVVGVEVNPDLVAASRTNIATWIDLGHANAPIHLRQQDAREFEYPSTPVLMFLYNPFGEATLLQVLAKLTNKGGILPPLDVLYCYPKHGYVFNRKSHFKELWMTPIPLDEEDRSTDAFGSKFEVCALYRRQPEKSMNGTGNQPLPKENRRI